MKLNNKKGNKNNGKKGSPNIMGIVSLVVWALIITVLLNYFFSFASSADTVEVKFSEFISLVKEDKVEEVKMENSKYTLTLKESAEQGWLAKYYADDKKVNPKTAAMPTLCTIPLNYTNLAQLLDEHDVDYYAKTDSAISSFLFSYILPMALMILAMGRM